MALTRTETIKLNCFSKPATIKREVAIAPVASKKPSNNRQSSCYVPAAGTIAEICWEYQKSARYKRLENESRRQKDYYVSLIEKQFGRLPVEKLTAPKVFELQERLSQTPGKANCLISTLSCVMKFGVQIGLAANNPAEGVERLPTDEYKPWPKEVLQRVISHAGQMERLAIVTALFSGQRISDCIRITHTMVSTGIVEIVQKKTKKTVYIPVHPRWLEEVKRVPTRADTILYDHYGRPFQCTDTLRYRIKDVLQGLGYDQYVFHGLRKNATNFLAELGLTHHEISTITGMDIKTLMHYTKGFDARRTAERISTRIYGGSPLD